MGIYIAVLIALALFTYFSYVVNRRAVISSYFYIYYFAFSIASAFAIEAGAYMLEIERYGEPNGTLFVLSLFFLSGLVSLSVGYAFYDRFIKLSIFKVSYSSNAELWFSYVFILISISVAAYIVVMYSSPILLKIERFQFWSNVVPPTWQVSKSLITQTFFFIPAVFLITGNIYKLLVLMFLWCFITVFVMGEKFTAFQYYLTIGGLYLAALIKQGRVTKFPVKTVVFVLFALVGIIMFVYERTGYSYRFILDRFALQSQLTWLVVEDQIVLTSLATGREVLERIALSPERYTNYYSVGIGLTGYMPAVHIAYFGLLLGLLLHCMICVILGFAQAEVVRLISCRSVIQAFVLFKLYISLLYAWFVVDYTYLFNKVNVMCISILSLTVFLRQVQEIQRRNGVSEANV